MGYVGSDDVGNIHKVQVCTLMKYYPDQAVGSTKMVSRHTKRIAKVTMDPEVKNAWFENVVCVGVAMIAPFGADKKGDKTVT